MILLLNMFFSLLPFSVVSPYMSCMRLHFLCGMIAYFIWLKEVEVAELPLCCVGIVKFLADFVFESCSWKRGKIVILVCNL